MMLQQSEWLTIGELMDRAGVSRRTIYNWLATGRLEVRETPGGRQLIALDSCFTPRTKPLKEQIA